VPGSLVGDSIDDPEVPPMPNLRRRIAASASAPTQALRGFLATEVAGGLLLAVAAVVALVWANSPWSASYQTVWETPVVASVGRHSLSLDLRHWVNDGLMALFFLVVALEIKRELLQGELRDRRAAVLPVVAAIGGMAVPAAIYLSLNVGGSGSDGWGIPMATDIAFALGVLALVARSAPPAVRLFLLTLAIVDDIGAILVIAAFYSSDLAVGWLAVAGATLAFVWSCRRAGFTAPALFAGLGIGLWLALHASGVHATLAGVLMGLLVPATPAMTREIVRSRSDDLLDVFSPAAAEETVRLARRSVSELEWLEHRLHGWTSFLIVPLFALANAGVSMSSESLGDAMTSRVTLGVVAGLVLGKALGISGAAWLACRLGIADLPENVTWRQIAGVAFLGGIGFTVSIFIAGLAFHDGVVTDEAKIGIVAASLLASFGGWLLLRTASEVE
jgi:NhaA family Na+:H+ antiporter